MYRGRKKGELLQIHALTLSHLSLSLSLSLFFFFFFFLERHPWCMEVPRLEVELELPAASLCHSHSHARSELHLSHIYDLHCSLTHWVRPGTSPHPYRHNVKFLTLWATTGTPNLHSFDWKWKFKLFFFYCLPVTFSTLWTVCSGPLPLFLL